MIKEQHQNKLNQIVEHIKANGHITNKQAKELCDIADSTATKYLQELENKGLIQQIGTFGPNVKYRMK